MGRNNHDYKLKDKNLTKNKKNAKLNKSIAFTLAGMAAIGAGAMAGGQAQEAQAMMGKVGGSVASKVTNGFKGGVVPSSRPVSMPKVGPLKNGVHTSRFLGGAPGGINSGRYGSNGTQYKGIGPQNHNKGIVINKTQNNSISSAVNKQGLSGKTNPGPISQQVQANGITGKGFSTSSGAGKGTPGGNQTSSLGGLSLSGTKTPSSTQTGQQKSPLSTNSGASGATGNSTSGLTSRSDTASKFQPGKSAQQMYNQQNNTGDKVHTTEGFHSYRLK